MKILIINGYGKSIKGLKSFEQYKQIVRDVSVFNKLFKLILSKKEMIDTEIDFIIRDRDSIDDLLYEIDSSYVRLECGKMFDSIDIIFFEGDSNLRPWSPNAYKFLIILRMCLRSNKILFASSFAMQGLVFLIASNVECQITIINGLNGGQLGDLSKIKKELTDIKQTDFFLDNVTGDLYGFNYDSGEWSSKGNTGIHFRRAAEEFKTIGKYIIKAPQYKVSRMKEIDALYVSKENEIVCALRKNHMHHYLFNEISFEFVVPFKNSWDVHPFNFVNPKKTFQTLADCEKGPMVIQISDNIIGVQFPIKKKYKETQTILKNYMGYQLTKLCSGQSHTIPIEIASIKQNDNAMDIFLESVSKNKYNGHQKTIKFNIITEFHHAGYAAKKSKQLDVVVNNAIAKRKIKQKNYKISSELDNYLSQNESFKYPCIPNNNSRKNFTSNPPTISNSPIKQITQHQIDDLQEQKQQFNKTYSEILKILHPNISESLFEDLNKQHLWVPGYLSQHRSLNTQSPSDHNNRPAWNQKVQPRKIKKSENDSSNQFSTKHQINLKDEKQQSITKQQLRYETPIQQTYNVGKRNLSLPQHQFRIIQKDKWVAKQDFKV